MKTKIIIGLALISLLILTGCTRKSLIEESTMYSELDLCQKTEDCFSCCLDIKGVVERRYLIIGLTWEDIEFRPNECYDYCNGGDSKLN